MNIKRFLQNVFFVILALFASSVCCSERWSKLLSLLDKKLDYYVHTCWKHNMILDRNDLKRLSTAFGKYMEKSERKRDDLVPEE